MGNIKFAESSVLIGKIRYGENVYISQGAVLRSKDDSISIGNSSMVLENSVIIGTKDNPVKVGSKTVFGHKCIIIGAEIGNLCEIGNGVMMLPGSKIGNMCIFGEGTIIPKGTVIPDESVVVGRPAKVIRKLTEDDKNMIKRMRGNDISLKEFKENIFEKEGEVNMGTLHRFKDKYPSIADSAFIHQSAELTGDVIVGENSKIGSGVKIIGDSHGPVRIGKNVNILENTVLHLLPDNQLIIEDNVSIGPSCIVHGTVVGENTVIEAGSIICDYSRLGKNTLVKSGSLVKQRSEFGENEILEGFPAKSTGKNERKLEKPDWIL